MRSIILLFSLLVLAACASNPHKAEKIDTKIENSSKVSTDENVGIKDGNLVVQKKVLMNEELRRLQIDVYSTEDSIYGNARYGSLGMYGVLRECRKKLADKHNGGTGKLLWTEPLERVTENEEPYNIGIDESNQIVAVSEEFLKVRIDRFQRYMKVLRSRETEYRDKLDICQAELASRQFDAAEAAAKSAVESTKQ